MLTVIADYGMGNLFSIRSVIEHLGVPVTISAERQTLLNASHIVLPGVGSFSHAMETIATLGLDDILREHVKIQQRPLLGICLGMQLLGASSTEDGFAHGLHLVSNPIERFSTKAPKIPHIGFNSVYIDRPLRLFDGIDSGVDFYFVHSYRMSYLNNGSHTAWCEYGDQFIAAIECDNVFGTQFHPELSQGNGVRLIHNFLHL